MTNGEKFREEIINFNGPDRSFCVNFIEEHILPDFGLLCADVGCDRCRVLAAIWAREEYKEPEIDWSKVPVDTPIYVRNNENVPWVPRHFAEYKNGEVRAYFEGTTSFTTENQETFIWEYAKLAQEGAE